MVGLIWLIPLYQAILSRACGGGAKVWAENYLYAIPYALPIYLLAESHGVSAYVLAAVAALFAGALKGQANRVFMDLGTWTGPERGPHRYEVVLKYIKPYVSPYWYDFIGLILLGLAPALVPALIAGWFNPVAGLILAAGGMSKAPAYAIGHWLTKWKTETGEFLTGAGAGISIIISYML